MNPESFVDPHLPLADLVVLDTLLGDIESRTGSRDVAQQKGHDGTNGNAASVISRDASIGDAVNPQNGNANRTLCES